jgi:hypothetical protein
VLDLCALVDKNGTGVITPAEFKRICQTCNYRIVNGMLVKDEPVFYNEILAKNY